MVISDQTVISVTNTFLTMLPPTLVALAGLIATLRNGSKTDKLANKTDNLTTGINGRMTELVQKTRDLAHKEGREAGIKEIVEQGQVGVVVGIVPTAKGQEDQKHDQPQVAAIGIVPVSPLTKVEVSEIPQGKQFSGEVTIRDAQTKEVIARRHPDSQEVMDALGDPTKTVE